MNSARRVRLGLLFVVALGLLGTVVVISYRTTARFVAASEEAARTSRLLLQLERTFSAMQDVETGQRGFLLTGDERYLAPYAEALKRIEAQRRQLGRMAAGHPDRIAQVAATNQQIDAKLAELDESIRAYRERGPDAARVIMLTGRGRVIMDSLRGLIGQMEIERQEDLRTANAGLRSGATNTLLTILSLGGLALVLLGEVCFLGLRYVRERQRAEAALLAESAALEGNLDRLSADLGRRTSEFDTLLDVLPVGIAVGEGPACARLRVNAAFAELHGMPPGADEGWITPPTTSAMRVGMPLPLSALPLARAAATGKPVHGEEYDLLRDGGATRHVLAYAAPLLDEAGRSRGAVGAFLDITDRKRAQAEAQHAQQLLAMGQLAGGVAHDFNNLLTAISGYASLMLTTLGPNDPRRVDVAGIHDATTRASALTQQLLAFGRKQVMEPSAVDLREVLADTGRMLERLIGEHIDLAVVADPALGPVFADRSQVSQVLVNLALNARDAMPDGGRLTIEARDTPLTDEYAGTHFAVTPGSYVRIAVSDTGHGMTPDVQARIFEPFFTTKPHGKGTGLGLSTVFGIVKQLGGHIFVYSEPGHGSTFKVYLPRFEGAAEPAPPALEPGVWVGGTETVLIVEDDAAIREVVRRVLEMASYTVVEAATPRDALAVAERHEGPIHLLLTDVVMPELTGRQLADRLLRQRPRLAVLYMSGYTDDAIVHQGRLDPDTAFLQKPFTPEALLHRVREVLDRRAANAAAVEG
jgi:signal transduction histidine kinase/CHASE3 domain sensor protein/ActR/RegA family two-component response regulator